MYKIEYMMTRAQPYFLFFILCVLFGKTYNKLYRKKENNSNTYTVYTLYKVYEFTHILSYIYQHVKKKLKVHINNLRVLLSFFFVLQ